MKKLFFFALFIAAALPAFSQKQRFDILSYGAKGDGRTDNTALIQHAIDDASAAGGGIVYFPAGRFLTGVLRIKSNVALHLAEKAVLLASSRRSDYGGTPASALLIATDQQHIAITGRGVIDGNGRELLKDIYRMLNEGTLQDAEWKSYNPWHQMRPEEKNRPKLIEFRNCDGVTIKGITILDGLDWIQKYTNCSDLTVDSIRVVSNIMWNNDGIDVVDCRKVSVTNSFFNADDDGICIKSENPKGRCEDIYIAHCTIRSSASAFKLGTASRGVFSNIKVRDLTIYDTYRSAIALESVDGAILENIDIRNVRARNTGNAIFLRLGHRSRMAPVGELRHIYISDVKVEVPAGKPDKGYEMEGPPVPEPHNIFPSAIVGIPGHPVQDVTLENIEISYPGGADKQRAFVSPDSLEKIPEQEEAYPEFSMFGELPASGLFARHVKGLHLNNVRLSYKSNDFRPACVFDDVSNVSLNDVRFPETGKGSSPVSPKTKGR